MPAVYSPSVYDKLIDEASDKLQRALRASALAGRFDSVNVWSVPSKPGRPGYLHVGETPPDDLDGARCVRPCDGENWGCSYTRWAAIPYSQIHSTLWRVCRREPILPIE